MKKYILLFCLISINLIASGQKKYIKLEVSPAEFGVGDEIILTVKTNIGSNYEIDLPSFFNRGSTLSQSMQESLDYNTGAVERVIVIAQNGSISKKGTFTIGPAFIKENGKVYKSNTVQVKVLDPQMIGTTPQKFDPNKAINSKIVSNKEVYYEGEPVILSASVITKFQPISTGIQYSPYTMEGNIDQYDLNFNKTAIFDRRIINSQAFYEAFIDKKLIFPVGIGFYKINPFSAIFNNGFNYYNTKSAAKRIEIKALPAGVPKDFVGAVGQYFLSVEMPKTNFKEGEVSELNIIISGSGNLHNVEAPKIDLGSEFTIYGDPQRVDNFIFTERGAEGKVTFIYNIQAQKDGKFKINPITISYFDLVTEKYISIKSQEIILEIENDPKYTAVLDSSSVVVDAKIIDGKTLHGIISKEQIINISNGFPLWIKIFIGISISTILIIIFSNFFKGIKSRKPQTKIVEISKTELKENLEKALELHLAGNTKDAYGYLQKALKQNARQKLNIESVHPTKSDIFSALESSRTKPEDAKNYEMIYMRCEEMKYSFGNLSQNFMQDYDLVKNLIQKLKS